MLSQNKLPTADCPVCGEAAPVHLEILIFGAVRQLHQCGSCEAAFYPDPDWLETAYSSAISSMDTGIAERCFDLANVLTAFLRSRRSEVFLDFGGGIGLLSRIMRDRGFDFHTWDPMAEYRLPLPKKEVHAAAMVSMVEVLEHLTDPVSELRSIAERTPMIFISTHLVPAGGLTLTWEYLQPETGQHIFFCTQKTLEKLAQGLEMSVTSNGQNLHVLHRSPLTLWQRTVIRLQQPAWVIGHLQSMFTRGRSLAPEDAQSSQHL